MKLPEEREDPTWASLRGHDVEELWDHSRAPHVAASYRARMDLLSRVIKDLAGARGRVLDVGCAQGTLGLMLAEQGVRVSLLDIRPENIEYARSRFEKGEVDFYVGFLSHSCPPSNDYEVVVCTEVIEHVPAPAQFLSHLKDKVRPGGALCLTTPNADYLLAHLPSYGRAPQAVIDEAEPNSLDGNAHRYLYTREDLIVLVRGVGLQVEQHGFFLPAWLEGHLKTRYFHRLFYQLRKDIVHLPAQLPDVVGRRFCSSQYLVARRPIPASQKEA
jgi:2-polyprenyl-3-methyl-5-hydroxy-6-metoxy-1,4-benzoquinol methylase